MLYEALIFPNKFNPSVSVFNDQQLVMGLPGKEFGELRRM